MLKAIKVNPRKTKNFHSSFLASLFVAIILGGYFSLLLDQNSLPKWTSCVTEWITWTILLIIFMVLAYKCGTKLCFDMKSKQNFFDNFVVSILVMILGTLLILYHALLKNWLFALVATAVIVGTFFLSNWVSIKFRPR